MFGVVNYAAFIGLAITLNMIPGLDTLFVLSRTLEGGRRAGFASALGVSTGVLIHSLLAGAGLGLVLSQSQELFFILKMAGACYLIYLAIQTLKSSKHTLTLELGEDIRLSFISVYKSGILSNLLNPKVIIFFVALFPQFVSFENNYGIIPFIILGITIASTSVIWSSILAVSASWVRQFFERSSKAQIIFPKISALIYFLLGLAIFFTYN